MHMLHFFIIFNYILSFIILLLFQFEFTFLLYLNPNWTADMYAETSFYDYGSHHDTEEGVDFETLRQGNQSFEFISK